MVDTIRLSQPAAERSDRTVTGRKTPIPHDTDLYRKRHRIENTFARLKDWRRIATRYDRCPILFLSACALAATVIYWL
jgi:transposase